MARAVLTVVRVSVIAGMRTMIAIMWIGQWNVAIRWNLDRRHRDRTQRQIAPHADQERVIVVETWNVWSLPSGLRRSGLATRIYNLVFTRPRFASQVAFEGSVVSDGPYMTTTTTPAREVIC